MSVGGELVLFSTEGDKPLQSETKVQSIAQHEISSPSHSPRPTEGLKTRTPLIKFIGSRKLLKREKTLETSQSLQISQPSGPSSTKSGGVSEFIWENSKYSVIYGRPPISQDEIEIIQMGGVQ